MRRTYPHPVSAMALLCVIVATSGCATVSSIDVPWKTQTDRSATAPASQPHSSTETPAGESAVQDATYWAKKAISASSQIAYARHLRTVTEKHPKLFAAKTRQNGDTTDAQPSAEASDAGTNGTSESSQTDGAEQTQPDAPSDAVVEQTSTTASSPKIRTVPRNGRDGSQSKPEVWPVALQQSYGATQRGHTPADPTLDKKVYDLSDAEARETISEKFGIDVPDEKGAVAIPGTYLPPEKFEEFIDNEFHGFDHISEKQRRTQVAVVVPGDSVTVYAGDDAFASREFDAEVDLPSNLTAVRPVRVVQDGTIQLLAYWPETTEDGPQKDDTKDGGKKGSKTIRYQAGILKVIGPHVGTLFEETIATRPADADDSELQRTGYVDFLNGENHRRLRWIPADEKGRPNVSQADVLEWNRWEGVFRVPTRPPTAPDQTS